MLWDGGNNDLPFYAPDLHLVLADPLRPGDEAGYHPGEANVRMADLVIVAKCDSARPEDIEAVEASVRALNPRAEVLRCDSPVTLDDPTVATGRRVVVIEDGPTLTHGSMSFGAGVVGARDAGAAEIVDPTPFAVGSIAATYAKYPNARGILPAMGYGEAQTRDLEATIRAMVDAGAIDAIVSGTPVDITRVLTVDVPLTRARYELREQQPGRLAAALAKALGRCTACRAGLEGRAPRRVSRRVLAAQGGEEHRREVGVADVLERHRTAVGPGERHPPVRVLVVGARLVDRPVVPDDVGQGHGEHPARRQRHPPVQRLDDRVDAGARAAAARARRTRRAACAIEASSWARSSSTGRVSSPSCSRIATCSSER